MMTILQTLALVLSLAVPTRPPGPRIVHLSIDSEPSNARIVRTLDGASLGRTPVRLPRPALPGRRSYTLRLEGYEDNHISVPADQSVTIKVRLVPVKKPSKPAPAPTPTPSSPPSSPPSPSPSPSPSPK